jgi:hypothetical protein
MPISPREARTAVEARSRLRLLYVEKMPMFHSPAVFGDD